MGNIQAATTTQTSLTNTVKNYYDRMMLEWLKPSAKYYQFGVKKSLPAGEGKAVIWNRPLRLGLGFTLSEGVPTSTANALSTAKVSALVQQYGGFTAISDMVDMTSITDVQSLATQVLAQQAAETIERAIISECFIAASATDNNIPHHLIKTSAEVTDFWGAVSGVSVCSNGSLPGGPLATVSCLNVLAVSDIRSAVYKLKALNATPYEGNDFVAIVNTETAANLVGDSTWINFHQYAAPGQENLYSGEIGKIYGCRFVETNLGPVTRGSNDTTTASSLAYGTVIMGKGFYGVTELDGGLKTFTSQGADKADPLNQTTTKGWKMTFASKILNVSAGLVFWAGVGSGYTTTIGDESASGSVLRYKAPTAY
jgi:N4-gp56 family major capsid protein